MRTGQVKLGKLMMDKDVTLPKVVCLVAWVVFGSVLHPCCVQLSAIPTLCNMHDG
jgi:hypothetical protein